MIIIRSDAELVRRGSAPATLSGPPARRSGERPKLLLVDDEPTVGRMLFHAAEECGYRALLATSGQGFRCQYDLEHPEVVLLDLSLPGGDGIELLRFLAERQSRALVLIVSGFDRRVVDAAARLGSALGLRMGGALTKPVRVQELAEAIAQGLEAAEQGGSDEARLCHGS